MIEIINCNESGNVYGCAGTRIIMALLCSVGLQKYYKAPQIFQQGSHCISGKLVHVSNE